jgi:two-component system response regulator PilR (NtrC family)
MKKGRILIVDDEKGMREFLSIMLKKEGYDCAAYSSGEAALEHFKSSPSGLAIVDLKMPGMGGLKLLKELKELNPEVSVIVVTAYASVDSAVEAMKLGAYDYFTKPFNVEDIKVHIKRALDWKKLEKENIRLKEDIRALRGFENIIGKSPRMTKIYALVCAVAPTKTNILVTGESGTGKELVARAIHEQSERRDGPFVSVNCGAIPEALLESELFGHVKGAFTGADANREGLAEAAAEGTLFMDEITELPLPLQVKLLRFIQEKKIRRVGSTTDIPLDIRFIAATNKNPEEEVKKGRFREDLFYRLNVVRVEMPPLRERKEDIPELARFFLEKYNKSHGKDIKGISAEALSALLGYDYPGNVRELENAIERATALEAGDYIRKETLPPQMLAPGSGFPPPPGLSRQGGLEEALSQYEKTLINDALRMAGGVKKRAAEMLGITFRSMRHRLSKYRMSGSEDESR